MISHRRPKFAVVVGFRDKLAYVTDRPSLTLAEAEAMRLRKEYPDPRAEFWVSAARVVCNYRWSALQALLTERGPARPIFNQSTKHDADDRYRRGITRAIREALRGERGHDQILGLPYTPSELIAYLESKFLPGMNWGNRDRWHIHHIKPRAKFDMRDPKQLMACWALSNLQPLWVEDHMRAHAA